MVGETLNRQPVWVGPMGNGGKRDPWKLVYTLSEGWPTRPGALFEAPLVGAGRLLEALQRHPQ